MWIQAKNELSEVNLNSLKPEKELDKAIAQLCVTLIKKRYAKNTGIPNDIVVDKWVNSIDVFITTLLLFERTHFSQYAIITWNIQEREEQS